MGPKFKLSLLKRYLISYIFIFSISFIVLLLIINNVYIQNTKEELLVNNENLLEQSNSHLNENLVEVRALGDYINEKKIFHHTLEDKKLNSFDETIKQYEMTGAAVQSIYIVLEEGSQVLTSNGSASLKALFLNHPLFSEIQDTEKFKDLIFNNEQKVFVSGDQLFYMMPLNSSDMMGSILIEVNTDEIQEMIQVMNQENNGASFLLSAENELLLYESNNLEISKKDLESLIPKILTQSKLIIDKKPYLSQEQSNELTDMSFVVITDQMDFYRPLYKVIIFSSLMLMIMMALGFFFSYYFAYKNYQPIDNLLNRIKVNETPLTNEWEVIEKNLVETHSEVENLSSLVDEQTPIIRNSVLLDLINGDNLNLSELKSQFKIEDIYFPFDYFAFGIISFEERETSIQGVFELEQIQQKLTKELTKDVYLELVIPYLDRNKIFLIVNSKNKKESRWYSLTKKIKELLENYFDLENPRLKIAVSSIFKDRNAMNKGYIEASSVLEEMSKKDNILFFKELELKINKKNANTRVKYPEKSMLLLLQSIKQGNDVVANELLEQIFVEIEEKNREMIINEAIVAYLFNNILQLSHELGLRGYSQYLLQMQHFDKINQAKELLKEIIEKICQELESKRITKNEKLAKEINEYLHENFDSNDISLNQIASDYDISISYASKLIKEETGVSFSRIIQNLRMAKFKKILLETSQPIKKIVKEIGYLDVSNFTRKFRKENGMTPSQYRKKFNND